VIGTVVVVIAGVVFSMLTPEPPSAPHHA